MARSPEAVAELIRESTASGFRNDLLAKGQARSMIWRDGALPDDAPPFSPLLSYDLLSYAYALMTQGLRLLDGEAEHDAARLAFESAASAIEAAITRGPTAVERDFHRLVAGACYHLARYSARAFSLLYEGLTEANLTRPERALAMLMLRDLDGLFTMLAEQRLGPNGSEKTLIEMLSEIREPEDGVQPKEDSPELEDSLVEVVDAALSDHFLGAVATAMLAFERGERGVLDAAIARLRTGLEVAGELGLVPQWWCHRLAIHLLGDLWSSSFHERLPTSGAGGDGGAIDWERLRELFIATLMRRDRAEIDLWPSQMEAASRALDLTDNMVVSLPTSAGKTRIAELCILACLASGRRVVFVTPLRALSAQTEVSLQRTFRPLGKSVSSLYGAIGASEVDEDFLRESDIIVATPEKLDFALRNDPDLLNDVGLVVLDEGHMIGLTEREVRYEVQIQRLLRRDDAAGRRIVCLSAILPDGDQLADFTAWLTRDQADGLVKKDWRPTRLRYGEVLWKGDHARLDITVGAEQPWIENFLTPVLPKGRRVKMYPGDQRELCIATAWQLVSDDHSVLIFCPLRVSVEPFAEAIVNLAERGAIHSVLEHDAAILDNALAIGAEWLGEDSPVLTCLKLGVAVHHGALPTAFRKEVERLLRLGVLKVTISSPTLAQGLNLSATTLIFHGLNRNGAEIDIAEFRNVVGRAGRAFVDVEGLVLYPMFDKVTKRSAAWKAMIANEKGKEMESGLLRLVQTLLARIVRKHGLRDGEKLIEYVAGNAAWEFPVIKSESAEVAAIERNRWAGFLTTLDTAILSMLGDREVVDDELEAMLDDVLSSSLWLRRLASRRKIIQRVLKAGLAARARFIWKETTQVQRRGYFLAGIGLGTGQELDAQAAELNQFLVTANGAILEGQEDAAIEAITDFAELAFAIPPFVPPELPGNWRGVLAAWLKGETIADLAADDEATVLQFVEQSLVYRLPWAMEAVRVRAIANGDELESGIAMEDVELGVAVAAVETGTLDRAAAVLMRAGFGSRVAAIRAVEQTGGDFTDMRGLRGWLRSEKVFEGRLDPEWPTAASHGLWLQFLASLMPADDKTWSRQTSSAKVSWDGDAPKHGTPVQLFDHHDMTMVLGADLSRLGQLEVGLNHARVGLTIATVEKLDARLDIRYIGPRDLLAS